jgi:hypothetical protein
MFSAILGVVIVTLVVLGGVIVTAKLLLDE